jgi:hypothetical protein
MPVERPTQNIDHNVAVRLADLPLFVRDRGLTSRS